MIEARRMSEQKEAEGMGRGRRGNKRTKLNTERRLESRMKEAEEDSDRKTEEQRCLLSTFIQILYVEQCLL